MLFYITILLNLAAVGVVPPVGWMQDTVGYETKEICEEFIVVKMPLLAANIGAWTGGAGKIDTWECLTEKEWIKRNNDLGHATPKEFVPKESKSKIYN
jgi:hypothetical protein